MRVLVTGSSGLIGSELVRFLRIGHHKVYRLVRDKKDLKPNEIAWDPSNGSIDKRALEGFDAVVHLAGENIAAKWSEEKKRKIKESRVKSTSLLVNTLSQLQDPPEIFISGSAIGYYGSRGSEMLIESSSKGNGFLAEVCAEWEAAAEPAVHKGIRTVFLRTGMVLSLKGGALKRMVPAFKWGLGGVLGNGKQYISWISIDDLIGIIYYLMRQKELAGPINAVSPDAVTNEEFTKILASVLNRPAFFKIPRFVLQMLLGDMADELLLSSQRVVPAVLEEQGFRFEHPTLQEALTEILY